jgi:hypothetical protein
MDIMDANNFMINALTFTALEVFRVIQKRRRLKLQPTHLKI